MGTARQDVYDLLKTNLYQDDAVTGLFFTVCLGVFFSVSYVVLFHRFVQLSCIVLAVCKILGKKINFFYSKNV